MGFQARQFRRALRAECDLNTAGGVLVFDEQGALTLLGTFDLDRAALAQALIGFAFTLTEVPVGELVPTQRGAAPDSN